MTIGGTCEVIQMEVVCLLMCKNVRKQWGIRGRDVLSRQYEQQDRVVVGTHLVNKNYRIHR